MSHTYLTGAPQNAVNHYTDWGAGSWVVWLAVLALSLIAFQAAVLCISDDRDAIAVAVACVVSSAILFPWSLYLIVRHAPSWRWALFTVAAAVLAAAVIALRADQVTAPKTFMLAAGLFVTLGVAVWIWDGLNRLASGIPTSVGVVVLAVVGRGGLDRGKYGGKLSIVLSLSPDQRGCCRDTASLSLLRCLATD